MERGEVGDLRFRLHDNPPRLQNTLYLQGWYNVLVEMEQIGWVIAVLEGYQSGICRRWIGLANSLLPLIHEKIYIHSLSVGRKHLPQLFRASLIFPITWLPLCVEDRNHGLFVTMRK